MKNSAYGLVVQRLPAFPGNTQQQLTVFVTQDLEDVLASYGLFKYWNTCEIYSHRYTHTQT